MPDFFIDEPAIKKTPEFKDQSVIAHLKECWKIYAPYADEHFLRETQQAIQDFSEHPLIKKDGRCICTQARQSAFDRFQQRYWEMHCTCVALNLGLQVVPYSKRPSHGPDILIEHNGQRVWIECVSPTKGSGINEVPQPSAQPGILETGYAPTPEITLRYTSALVNKKDELIKNYMAGASPSVSNSDSYIIAVNGHSVYPTNTDFEGMPPSILNCLYGLGNVAVDFSLDSDTASDPYITRREFIERKDQSPIPNTAFEDDEFKWVSGVIFSRADPWNRRGEFLSTVYCIPNVNAFNILEDDFVKVFDHWNIEANGIRFKHRT